MKKLYFLLAFAFSLTSFTFGQKFGYIDSEGILEKMPEYKEAQKEIDKISIQYQKEIEKMRITLDSTIRVFEEERILLTEEMVQKRLKAIRDEDSKIREKQTKIFGFEGLIFLKRQELIKPVQDKIFAAVKAVCKQHKVQVMFDKSGDLTMIYASPTHDYSDYVLEELGLGENEDETGN